MTMVVVVVVTVVVIMMVIMIINLKKIIPVWRRTEIYSLLLDS